MEIGTLRTQMAEVRKYILHRPNELYFLGLMIKPNPLSTLIYILE